MPTNYSRRAKVEEQKNIRRAYLLGFLSIAAVIFLFFLGIPLAAKSATFIADFLQNSQTIDSQDDTPPPSPRLDELPEFSKDKEIEISGTTEPGATVLLFVNDDYTDTLANKEGVFHFETSLREGENTIYAKAKDTAGNESIKTTEYTITYDNTAPELTVSKPADGASFYGTSQKNIVIEGTTEEDASVHVNDRIAIVNSEGKFVLTLGLNEGETQLVISAQDPAGNSTETTITVTYFP